MRKGVLKDDRTDGDAAQTVDLRQNDFSGSVRVKADPPPGTKCRCRQNRIRLQHGRYGSNVSERLAGSHGQMQRPKHRFQQRARYLQRAR
jgi:hypothetical protein